MRVRTRSGSQIVESALILPLLILIVAFLLSFGLREVENVRERSEMYGEERSARDFAMPEEALYLSSLVQFSEAFSSPELE